MIVTRGTIWARKNEIGRLYLIQIIAPIAIRCVEILQSLALTVSPLDSPFPDAFCADIS